VNRYLNYGECQARTISEPEQRGCEELSAAAAVATATDCPVMKDVKSPQPLPSAVVTGSVNDAGAKAMSSAGGEKKKMPKLGMHFISVLLFVHYSTVVVCTAMSA